MDNEGKPSQREYEGWRRDRELAGYPAKPDEQVLRIYTTRPDTLFGATYMVIAPEHPFVERLTAPEQAEAVKAYCEKATRKSDLDRTELAKDKTGVFTGSYAINPVTGQPIPIWVADYVLISYGTGAIMAVPAHDSRDFDFAEKFALPIKPVVMPNDAWLKEHLKIKTHHPGPLPVSEGDLKAQYLENVGNFREGFTDDGHAVNSGVYDGLPTAEFKQRIAADLSTKGLGRAAVNYKLRDWLFSRQHFWGEPFPILRELDEHGQPNGRLRALKPEDLPLDLPEMMKFDAAHDRPEPPLDKAPDSWLYLTLDGKRYKRETNTMPQWAGSCWYFLRFLDPKNKEALVDPALEKAWMPVDLYVGGAEHAVLHLLYARFWHKVLYDRGYVSMPEPFQKLVNQGMILGETEYTGYRTESGAWVGSAEAASDADGKPIARTTREPLAAVSLKPEEVAKQGEVFVLKANPSVRIESRAYKMSKARGNVVNPDEVVQEYRGRLAAAVRDVHGSAGGRQAVEHERRQRHRRLSRSRLATGDRRSGRRDSSQRGGGRYRADGRAEPRAAQDHPGGDTGHRADVVQYGHCADDGVHELLFQGPTAAQGGAGAVRAIALALRPASGRRALAAIGPCPDVGLRAVAGVRRGPPQGRHDRDSRTGQRQASRADRGCRRGRSGRHGSCRPGRRKNCRTAGRQDDREDDHRPRKDGQLRRQVKPTNIA